MHSTDFFNESTSIKSLLTSTNQNDLLQGLHLIFEQKLNTLTSTQDNAVFFGHSPQELSELYKSHRATLNNQDRQSLRIEEALKLSTDKRAAIAHIDSVQGMLSTASHFMNETMNYNQNRGEDTFTHTSAKKQMIKHFETLKAKGFVQSDIKHLYGVAKIWPIYTPHPTPDKSEEGKAFFHSLLDAVQNTSADMREEKIRETISNMLRTRLTPARKITRKEETLVGIKHQETWREGALAYMNLVEESANIVFGKKTLDFTDATTTPEFIAHVWNQVDLDGKRVPAPVAFGQRVLGAQHSINFMLKNIQTASSAKASDKTQDIIAYLKILKSKVDSMCDPQDIENLEHIGSKNPVYLRAVDEFVNIFENTLYKGQASPKGPSLPNTLIKDLKHLQITGDSKTQRVAWDIIVSYNLNGIGTGRSQPRHDHNDIETLYKNFIAHIETHHPNIIREFIGEGHTYDGLNDTSKLVFLNRLQKRYGDQFKGWFLAANPGSYVAHDGNDTGWPDEILAHIQLRAKAFNHNRIGATVISNAQPPSSIYEQILHESFGIQTGIYMDLNEEKQTVNNTKEKLEAYEKVIGLRNIEKRSSIENKRKYGQPALAVKDSLSDTKRLNGLFIRMDQKMSRRDIVELALKTGTPINNQQGGGMASSRGGGSLVMTPRILLETIAEVADRWEKPFTRKERDVLKQMYAFAANTYQGRHPIMALGTSQQCFDLLNNTMGEIATGFLAIDGKIKFSDAIPAYSDYPILTKLTMKDSLDTCTKEYSKMRNLPSNYGVLGPKRLNEWSNATGAPYMTQFTNNSQRSAIRPGSAKSEFENTLSIKALNKSRAIHYSKMIASTGTYAHAFYTAGQHLKDLSLKYKNGEISKNDLKLFWNDPYRRDFIFAQSFAGLSHADFEFGFDQIELDRRKKRITIGKLRQLHSENYKNVPENLIENTAFQGTFTMDALEFVALYEALGRSVHDDQSGPAFDASYDEIMSHHYNDDDLLNMVQFGQHTSAQFPFIKDEQCHAKRTHVALAMLHAFDKDISAGKLSTATTQNIDLCYHIAMGWRIGEPVNLAIVSDRNGFGSRPNHQHALDAIATLPNDSMITPDQSPDV